MATASCLRSLRCCISVASLRSLGARSRSAALSACVAAGAAAPCPIRRVSSLSRLPLELGSCGGLLFPLHSAVAAARLTSRRWPGSLTEMGLSVRR